MRINQLGQPLYEDLIYMDTVEDLDEWDLLPKLLDFYEHESLRTYHVKPEPSRAMPNHNAT